MTTARLTDRAIVLISGPDAESFLQNIVTTDLGQLPEGAALPGALLTPQGKILFDFLISRAGAEAFRLECRADIADDFIRRLMLYRLRAKVEISKQEESVVTVSFGADSAASDSDSSISEPLPTASPGVTGIAAVRDLRFPSRNVFRYYGETPADTDDMAWTAFRIAHGVAESGSDYTLGEAFPHDVNLDELNGVGFRKGCYVGQEVVSRMQHRGTARRRVLIVSAEQPLAASGSEIRTGERSLGTLGSVAGSSGLALVRIDRVKEAMDAGVPITAGSVSVTLSIPAGARFAFPEDSSAAEEA